MATTAIVAEILIVGLEALAWITLALLTIFGTDWVDTVVIQRTYRRIEGAYEKNLENAYQRLQSA
jgi:hypothetical protein